MTKFDLAGALARNHERILSTLRTGLLEGTCCLLGEERQMARQVLERAKFALERQMDFEEVTLLPILSKRSEVSLRHDLATIRAEHRMFRGLFQKAKTELEAGRSDAFREAIRSLIQALGHHRTQEQELLHPPVQVFLSPDENLRLRDEVNRILDVTP